MNTTHANQGVLQFYRRLPFNYRGDLAAAVEAVRRTNSLLNYRVLVPILERGVTVLDVGCGTGWLVNGINFHYGKHGTSAHGVDFNVEAIRQGQAVASRLGLSSEFVESDLFEYRPAEAFDVVTSIGVLHHTDDCLAGLRHVFRHCVRDGGHAFIGLYHKYGRKPFLDHFHALKSAGASEQDLLAEFAALHSPGADRLHALSWFHDQVMHPHETQHTLEEVLPVLHSEGMELVTSSLNRFEPFERREELFELERSYYTVGLNRLRDRIYFPGFFVFLARKKASSDHASGGH